MYPENRTAKPSPVSSVAPRATNSDPLAAVVLVAVLVDLVLAAASSMSPTFVAPFCPLVC